MTSSITQRDSESSFSLRGTRGPRKICMIAYAFYESDTRVLQYATALRGQGDAVDVIALRRDNHPEFEILNGVNIYRVQSRTVNEKGLLAYCQRILIFLLRSTILLWRKHQQEAYDLIHVHNVPDFLVLAAMGPKLSGVPIILDIHDLLPEFYASKFKVRHTSFLFKLLVFVERISAAFATHVIVANHLWRDRFVMRSARAEKCSVVRNYPDLDIFTAQPTTERKEGGKFILTYPGSLNRHQGLDVAIRAFAAVANQMPDTEFHIYGEGSAKSELIELANNLELQGRIIFHDFLPSREIARVMSGTDLAIEPKRSTSAFGNEALSTKILEFMALGVPVLASRTKIHEYYYDNSVVQYYDNDDPVALARAMVELRGNPALRRQLAANATNYVQENNWQACRFEYLQLVDSLISRAHARVAA